MPVHAEGKDEVFVGRIRRDISHGKDCTCGWCRTTSEGCRHERHSDC